MDQGSSPHLPLGSLASKSYGSSECLLIGKRKSLGFDDSSSVTSMSSTSRATKCMACKQGDTVTKPLIMCYRCKWLIHPFCAKPRIDDYKATYTCDRCKKDLAQPGRRKSNNANSESSKSGTPHYNSPYATHAHPNSTSVSSDPVKESPKVSGTRPPLPCEVPGCKNPPIYSTSGPTICKKHEIEQRNASAKAAAPKPVPLPRPFKKDKLYPPNQELKELLREKRKRPPATKRPSSGVESDARQQSGATFSFQPLERGPQLSLTTQIPRKQSGTTGPSPNSRLKKAQEQIEKLSKPALAKNPLEVQYGVTVFDLPHLFGSAGMTEPLVEPPTNMQAGLFSRSNSARVNPQVVAQDTPDYSPPPPQLADDEDPWTGIDDRDDSPGSQIAQELAATASQQDISEMNDSLEFGRANLPSIEEEIAASHAHPYKAPQVRDEADEDEEMLDPDTRALIDRLASEHPSSPKSASSPPAHSPSSSTYSANVSSNAEEGKEAEEEVTAPYSAATRKAVVLRELLIDIPEGRLPPDSLEAIRAQRIANFNPTELDSFLSKQAQPQSDEQLTTKELLGTQIWGHIDPRVAWPRKMTPEEIAAKIKEIEARGGKKANYGKILTAQVRKERADNGWNIHQAGERRPEEEVKEMDRRLEEMFGQTGLANCVPGTRNERLVMIEQLDPEEVQTGPGRRKRRREPKVYPVIGAQ